MKNSADLAKGKLILMYMLNKMNIPVSLFFIQEFVLDSEYMDYFTLSEYLGHLSNNEYVLKSEALGKTTYAITPSGCSTLSLFDNLIDNDTKNDINEYVNINRSDVKKELEIMADFEIVKDGQFLVKCGAYENEIPLLEFNLAVSSRKYANTICDNWKKNTSKYYISFMKSLLNMDKK